MPRRSVRRFVLEVLFLSGVAAAATVADLRPAGVIALMGIAWVVVALLEWTSWLDEPHYGRGLPPRYYVPQTALPPPRAVPQGYGYVQPRRPAAVATPGPSPDDAPTFVEPADEWRVTLADWGGVEDETAVAVLDLGEPEPTAVVPLPPVLGIEETVEHAVVFPDEEIAGVAEDEPTQEPGGEPQVTEVAAAAAVVAHEVEPAAEPEPEHHPVEVAAAAAAAAVVPRPELVPEVRAREPEPDPLVLAAPARVEGVAVHRVDPLGGLSRGRFRLRRTHDEDAVEVDDGPPAGRALPERVLEQARAARE